MSLQDIFENINNWGEKVHFLQYSLLETLFFILIMVLTAKIVNSLLRKVIYIHYKGDNTIFILRLKTILVYVITFYGIFNLFKPFQSILTALAASGGILAVVIGFAAQEACGNFVNGLMIAIFKPFKIGDLVKVNNGEITGTVVDIAIRHTVIKTYENTQIVVPNSVMDKAILENVTAVGNQKGNFLELSIGYDCDLDLAMKIIMEEIMKHENFLDIRSDEEKQRKTPCVITRLVSFEESGMLLRTTVYSKNNAEGFAMLSDLRIAIKHRFDAAGIEFPYPHRSVILKNEKDSPRL